MNGIAIAILLLTFVFLLVIKCPITFSMVISTSLPCCIWISRL